MLGKYSKPEEWIEREVELKKKLAQNTVFSILLLILSVYLWFDQVILFAFAISYFAVVLFNLLFYIILYFEVRYRIKNQGSS